MSATRNRSGRALTALAALSGAVAYALATSAAWRLSSLGYDAGPLALVPGSTTAPEPPCRSAMEAYATSLSRSRISGETLAAPPRERATDAAVEAVARLDCRFTDLLAYGQAARDASDSARLAGGLATPRLR